MKTQTSKTAAVMGLLSRGVSNAPVPAGESAPTPVERTIDEITADILQAQQTGGEAVLTIGKGLVEAKEKLNHGEWLDWLAERVNYSPRMAQKLMKLAREWTNANALTHLGTAKAFALLVLPEDERENFMTEPHMVDGEEKTVIDMTSRELEKAVRERADALEAKKQAEAALARAVEEADRAAADSVAARKELDELKNRPVEVAVEKADPAEIEKAKAEARAEGEASRDKEIRELKDKLKIVRSERREAQEGLAKEENARKIAEENLAIAKAELASAKEQLSAPAQPAALTPLDTDADLAQFKLLFDQAQTIINQLHGLLLKVRKRNDEENAGKLEAALTALSDKVRGFVQ